MTTTHYSLTIEKTPEQVFAYLDDAAHLPKWLGGLVEIIPLTEGGNRIGAKTKHRYNENGREFEMTEETLVYEPNQRVKIKGETNFFGLTAEYKLTKIPNGTQLDFESDIRFNNPFLRLLSPLMAGSSKKKVKSDLERLKVLVEQQ